MSPSRLLAPEHPKMEVRPKPLREPVPPWLRHCYAVSLIDFRKPWAKTPAHTPGDDVETALFIQTGDKPVHGWLYSVHQLPYSRHFTLETKSCQDPKDELRFDSKDAIGYIYKSDFENRLLRILESCPLPEIPPPGYAVMSTPSEKPPIKSWAYAEDNVTSTRNSSD
ncbi:hypothetical protein EDB81DRAFT_788131 [Dactylonectria macrodidyma]|uniref:Uncharacterized protein n=1 Tax=Dactylonectria macrodidyma TaxID=307937 RepID=A0A9P9JG69_9HYPO|nr:hypothetical protein EDB81DRAFT_788131 [Dactylonectria macrodidyma]